MAYDDYMPGGDFYIPSGGGEYQIGDNEPRGIYAPYVSSYSPEQIADMNRQAYAPTNYNVKNEPSPSLASHNSWANGPSLYSQVTGGFGPSGYGMNQPQRQQPSGGQRAMAQQTPQQIALSKPEDDLYQRYKSLLMNPNFSGDPTYQFLYNQGLQALNRNLAAQRKTLSGQSMNDTMAYGAGMTSKYMQDLLPQYRGGAQEELNRFMGPAGLLPRYAGVNNAAIGQANNMTDRADMMSLYGGGGDLGLDRSGFTASGGSGIGWGGIRNQNNPGGNIPAQAPGYTPRPISFDENYSPSGMFDPYYDGYDIEGGPAYG